MVIVPSSAPLQVTLVLATFADRTVRFGDPERAVEGYHTTGIGCIAYLNIIESRCQGCEVA